ncbi:MAG: M42 family metallopeptidase [Kiritimatiellae bacterium]|nr:M42 family metallopeptidase [Kiritimatiellia bacterium]
MQKESLRFLRELLNTPSPSGHEIGAQALVRKRMARYCDAVTTDVHGNVIGQINPKAPLRVMLAGHCDEIGFIIMHIDDKGYIYIASVGGIDSTVAIAQRVKIHSRRGPVFGVIGRKPPHLQQPNETNQPPKIHELWIDIGAKNKKDAEKAVAIGDYITFDVHFEHMRNELVAARAFDDRAGAFVVAETLRRLGARKPKVAVFGVSTVQEEIGLRGARTSAYGIDPHVGIAIDVGFATDCPGMDPKRVGECRLGKGPALHRGPNINPVLGNRIEQVARRKRIPYQMVASPRATGTDANAIQITRSGVAAALISVPNRYMHTPVEIVSLKDLDNTSRLLAETILSLDEKISFIPH